MPVLIDKDAYMGLHDGDSDSAPPEKKMAFLVHLEISKMTVTVYTIEEFMDDQETDNVENQSNNSDELDDAGNEFQT